MILHIQNLSWKSDFVPFWQTVISFYSQNAIISFDYVDFWPNILLFKAHHQKNSTTELMLICVQLKPWQNQKDQTFVGMHRFWIPYLNFNQLPAAKKGFTTSASQQTFGPSYFDKALFFYDFYIRLCFFFRIKLSK